MKRTRNNKVLGLAIGDRSILVAEVAAGSGGGPGGPAGRPRVTKVGEFDFPAGVTLQQAGAAGTPDLGRASNEFLRAGGFTARTAVVGVPARWVLSKPKEVPPAGPDLIAESLRLQAEEDFPAEIEAVYDYAGETSPSEPRTVLLLAMPGRYVEQVSALAEAARLTVETITPVAVAVAAATARAAGPAGLAGRGREANKDALALSVGPGGAEFVASRGGHARSLRHLGSAASSPAALVGELRRAVAAVPGLANGTLTPVAPVADAGHDDDDSHTTPAGGPLNGNGRRALTVFGGGAATDPAGRKALADALGLSVDVGGLKGLGVTADGVPQAEAYAPAVAVA